MFLACIFCNVTQGRLQGDYNIFNVPLISSTTAENHEKNHVLIRRYFCAEICENEWFSSEEQVRCKRLFADPVSSTSRKAHAPSPNRRLIPRNQRLKTPPKDDIAMKKTTKDTTDNSTESTRESDLDPSPHLSSLRLLNALKKKSCRLRQKGRSAPQILRGKIPKTHQSTVWMTSDDAAVNRG